MIGQKFQKGNFNKNNKETFINDLRHTDWGALRNCTNTNVMFEHFINIFSNLYEKHFPLKTSYVKVKDLNTPWMTNGMKKSSKQKQKLYIKYLKRRNEAV